MNWLRRHRRQLLFALFLAAFVLLSWYLERARQLPDFREYPAGPERKAAFFAYVQPLLEQENARLLAQRHELELLAESTQPAWHERWWLRRMARSFGMDQPDALSDADLLETLLRRVDAVPVSLGLAQAAKESGWGTSRFAREANNLFGEWCYRPGCGLTPRRREAGKAHQVRVFDSPAASVRSYLDNLNTHPRYREFRLARAQMREAGTDLSGLALAAQLQAYSQRRQAYVDEISGIIRVNALEDTSAVATPPGIEGGAAPAGAEDDAAVVLLYHHVAEGTPASTSVTPAMFQRHLDFLADEGFQVVPLEQIVQALREGEPLPDRAVALTFDDAYLSVYTEALPRLERRGWPFTVFATTDYLDAGAPVYMNWDQLADLERRGGTIGNHSLDHAHLVRRRSGETQRAWNTRVRENIQRAQAQLERRLQHPLDIFAYPYGEFDETLERLVEDLDMVGIGQQSGAIGPASNLLALPRFPVATAFADLDSLADKLRSRPLPVNVLEPAGRVLAPGAAAPLLRLELGDGEFDVARLQCFVNAQPASQTKVQGRVLEVRAGQPLGPGRSKYTCTAPSQTDAGVYYWYSHLWIQPNADGSWYEG